MQAALQNLNFFTDLEISDSLERRTRCTATLAGASGDGASARRRSGGPGYLRAPAADGDATGEGGGGSDGRTAASGISAKSFQSQTPSGDRRVEEEQ